MNQHARPCCGGKVRQTKRRDPLRCGRPSPRLATGQLTVVSTSAAAAASEHQGVTSLPLLVRVRSLRVLASRRRLLCVPFWSVPVAARVTSVEGQREQSGTRRKGRRKERQGGRVGSLALLLGCVSFRTGEPHPTVLSPPSVSFCTRRSDRPSLEPTAAMAGAPVLTHR
jgi:hypothetical protein